MKTCGMFNIQNLTFAYADGSPVGNSRKKYFQKPNKSHKNKFRSLLRSSKDKIVFVANDLTFRLNKSEGFLLA